MAQGIGHEYNTTPLPEIRAGKTGVLETFTAGGTKASGGVTYALIQVAADTVTLNGVYARYTAAASDATKAGTLADPLLINIKASLTLTLDEAAIVLNAATHPSLVVATYSNTGGTVLGVAYDSYGIIGNTYTLAASAGGTVSAATLTGGQDLAAVSIATEPTRFNLTQSVDQHATLANGDEAQRKLIYVGTRSGAGNVVVTPTAITGGTIITFNAAAMWCELRFIAGAWVKTAGTATVS